MVPQDFHYALSFQLKIYQLDQTTFELASVTAEDKGRRVNAVNSFSIIFLHVSGTSSELNYILIQLANRDYDLHPISPDVFPLSILCISISV